MAITFDDYTYSQKLRLYNDENREIVGFNDVWTPSDGRYWHTDGATLGLYTIDCTVPMEDQDWTLLCSYKNGYTVKMKWYSYQPMYSDEKYAVSMIVQMFDKDGNQYGSGYSINNVEFDKFYNTPQHSHFLFSPPGFTYSLEYGDHPSTWNEGSIFTVRSRPIGAGLRPAPDIRNTRIRVDGLDGAGQWWGYYAYSLSSNFENFMRWIGEDGTPKKPEDDTSKPPEEKPDPDYDDPSDPIPDPDLPIGGDAISTGFIRVYAPTTAQLNALAGKLWDTDPGSFQQIIAKIQNDPMEAIISLHSIPYGIVGSSASCVIGNYDSGISMPTVTKQWYKISLGSLYLPEKWGSALDYSPYNTIDIFLPYIGVRSMQVDDVVGKTISVSYNTDVLSGATVASIMCGNSVLYSYNTVLTNEIPITQSSYGPMYSNILNGIGNVLSGYGSAGSPGAAAATVGSAINVAISKQHSVSRGGSIGGTYGCMGHFYPYLIIHRPIQSLASGFKHFKGYPSNITTSLGSISGYTEIESIHLDGIKCTEAERDEIRALLYNGVIF